MSIGLFTVYKYPLARLCDPLGGLVETCCRFHNLAQAHNLMGLKELHSRSRKPAQHFWRLSPRMRRRSQTQALYATLEASSGGLSVLVCAIVATLPYRRGEYETRSDRGRHPPQNSLRWYSAKYLPPKQAGSPQIYLLKQDRKGQTYIPDSIDEFEPLGGRS